MRLKTVNGVTGMRPNPVMKLRETRPNHVKRGLQKTRPNNVKRGILGMRFYLVIGELGGRDQTWSIGVTGDEAKPSHSFGQDTGGAATLNFSYPDILFIYPEIFV